MATHTRPSDRRHTSSRRRSSSRHTPGRHIPGQHTPRHTPGRHTPGRHTPGRHHIPGPRHHRSSWSRWHRPQVRMVALVTVVAVIVLARWLAVEVMVVRDGSMQPTLADGDLVLVDKLTVRWSPPEQGDLVVYAQDGGLVVKRVVATAGQTVAVVDTRVQVNGKPVAEPYLREGQEGGAFLDPVTVPTGHLFVLGDNRVSSVDSRDSGPLPVDQVIGRVRWH
ncbi:MAG: signal peptidase I [Angustibacter sp.]